MRRIVLVLSALVVAGSLVSAQPRGRARPARRLYDPATMTTVTGEVVTVEHVVHARGRGSGVHLVVKTDKETIPVALGPQWWVERQKPRLAPRDAVVVKGSRVTVDGKPMIIAQEVRKGDATLTLRDEHGVPAWGGPLGGRRAR